MRFFAVVALLAACTACAFVPVHVKLAKTTELAAVSRRDVLVTALAGLVAAPALSHASGSTFFFDEKIETVREASQMPTGNRVDLNSAFVGDYQAFPGMYPHAAGMIASHGPYASVKDIYKIPGITSNDIKLFKQYERAFTVNPPGRTFDERINARVST